jgi:hypothetical protein
LPNLELGFPLLEHLVCLLKYAITRILRLLTSTSTKFINQLQLLLRESLLTSSSCRRDHVVVEVVEEVIAIEVDVVAQFIVLLSVIGEGEHLVATARVVVVVVVFFNYYYLMWIIKTLAGVLDAIIKSSIDWIALLIKRGMLESGVSDLMQLLCSIRLDIRSTVFATPSFIP